MLINLFYSFTLLYIVITFLSFSGKMPVVRDWFIISVMELEISYLICLSILTDNPLCPQLDLVFKPSILLTVFSMSISLNLKLTLFIGECK